MKIDAIIEGLSKFQTRFCFFVNKTSIHQDTTQKHNMTLRRVSGFQRYALSIQYHGGSFLGFSYQGDQEDKLNEDGADLRGYRSVEGRLMEALEDLVGPNHYKNIQVSSRTDRGVHALKNTFHVDILNENTQNTSSNEMSRRIHRGLNYHLGRQTHSWHREQQERGTKRGSRRRKKAPSNYTFLGDSYWSRYSANDELRILNATQAPEYMENPFSEQDPSQPPRVDWNARFSATERTYIYRILCYSDQDENFGIPFEWDRSWRIRCNNKPLINVEEMQQAANFLQGTHDFTTFRGSRCQRSSPTVTMKSFTIQSQPYTGFLCMNGVHKDSAFPQLVTIQIVGQSFLYRQVRNMVGCLVDVGLGKLQPKDVHELLQIKDRRKAPQMAPAHGLFLADVQHGDFHF